jgi:hypothetical protein
MEIFDDTQALFGQLAAIPGALGVKTLIENHDAWAHSEALPALAAAWARVAAMPRNPAVEARIARQRKALEPLVTRLSVRYASAG